MRPATTLLLLAVALTACSRTEEMQVWDARRDELVVQLNSLKHDEEELTRSAPRLEALGTEAAQLTTQLDLAAQLRALSAPSVKLFQNGDSLRLVVDDEVEVCRDAVRALAPLRWLTGGWKLRLDQGRCHWEATQDFVLTHHVEEAVRPKVWVAPPHSLFSRHMDERRASVAAIEGQLREYERRLAPLMRLGELEAHVGRLRTVRDELRAHPQPCDLDVLERAVAQPRGTRLELESGRLIDPLEPLADERLKGLAVVEDGHLRWTCAH